MEREQLRQTTDARVWAKEFRKQFMGDETTCMFGGGLVTPERLEEMMRVWFEDAFSAGREDERVDPMYSPE